MSNGWLAKGFATRDTERHLTRRWSVVESYRVTNCEQGILSCYEWSLMARYRATNLQHGMLTELWLGVVVCVKLHSSNY